MSIIDVKINTLKNSQAAGYWKERIISQLEYAVRISKVQDGKYDSILNTAVDFLSERYKEEEAITRSTAMDAEKMLMDISTDSKKYKMICAAHAHIDMNWMWRWDETVSITLDTFRTMLKLMNEYPDFHFSQSQASVYRIVEEYDPEMLKEIKARVREGRWEVTASTWVEADKNLPNGESAARHILYTKRYLSKLLDIKPEALNLDFEPDTFGHNINVPEILSNGGVRYYYHCRGYDGHHLYNWTSPSGSSVIVYREPDWYNASIKPSMVLGIPEFCMKYGICTMLKVYGVGDHGGGPTRRDIERIIDMNTWPVFPQITFGTFGQYYQLVEKVKATLPVVTDELNSIFTGCYTTQTRIKTANRISEATLNEAEMFEAVCELCTGTRYSAEKFADAWENVLFNQFHDIIPGSGIVDTREHAMGLFQNTMAIANTRKTSSMRSIASRIDTSKLLYDKDISETTSEGAGVGFGLKDFRVAQYEAGAGSTRIFHIFNTSPYDREEAVEITVWDWNGGVDRLVFRDSSEEVVEHQLLDQGKNKYWDHTYMRILIQAKVPACGYSTYTMQEEPEAQIRLPINSEYRVERVDEFILENDYIKAIFDTRNAAIVSLVDKSTGKEFINKNCLSGIFRLITEDESKGMTAWYVGRYMDIEELVKNIRLRNIKFEKTSVRQTITFETEFSSSKLKVAVSLDYNSHSIKYDVECDWHEIGKKGAGIPQLSFHMPVGYECISFKYDIPFGTIIRKGLDMDMPSNNWVVGVRGKGEGKSIMLVSSSKYGFRCVDNSMNITLIRSSFDPDPYPELGIHKFSFAVCVVENKDNKELVELAYRYNHPLNVISGTQHKGELSQDKSFIKLEEGTIAISAIKMPEDRGNENSLIIRAYETDGISTKAVLSFYREVKNAYFVDINENSKESKSLIQTDGEKVIFKPTAHGLVNIRVEF